MGAVVWLRRQMGILTDRVNAAIDMLFKRDDQDAVRNMLCDECTDGLPLTRPSGHERIHLAILKISGGDVDEFLQAARLAQIDWRDVLVGADFGNDLRAHARWADDVLTKPRS
jgi:hypothetical protein